MESSVIWVKKAFFPYTVLALAKSSTQIVASSLHTDKSKRCQEFQLADPAQNSRACLTTICSAGAVLTHDHLWPECIARCWRRSVVLTAAEFLILHPVHALSCTYTTCSQWCFPNRFLTSLGWWWSVCLEPSLTACPLVSANISRSQTFFINIVLQVTKCSFEHYDTVVDGKGSEFWGHEAMISRNDSLRTSVDGLVAAGDTSLCMLTDLGYASIFSTIHPF